MGDFHFHAAIFYAASLAVLSGAVQPEEFGDTQDNIIDTSFRRPSIALSSGEYAAQSIKLSIEPPWTGDYHVNNKTREIDVLPGKRIVETSNIRALFEKYFRGLTPNRVIFDGMGVANYTDKHGMNRSLEILPLDPGTYHFGYNVTDENRMLERLWTVHSVPTFTVKPGSFFKFELNFTNYRAGHDAKIHNLYDVGVEVHPKRATPVIYGFADGIQNDTIIKIRMVYPDSSISTIKVRFLLEKSHDPIKLCRNHHKPCIKHIKLWMKNFDPSIQNRKDFLECVAGQFQNTATDLVGVKFEDYGETGAYFESRPREAYYCDYLGFQLKRIQTSCSQEIIGFDLTCTPQIKLFRLPATTKTPTVTESEVDLGVEWFNNTTPASPGIDSSHTATVPATITSSTTVDGRIEESSTTVKTVSEPSSTPAREVSSSTTPGTELTSTVSPEVSRSTPRIVPESSSTPETEPAVFTTTGSPDSRSTSASELTSPSPTDLGTSMNPRSVDRPDAPEANRTHDASTGLLSSFTSQIQFYAIMWTAVFIFLFFLIACLSR